MGEYIIRKAEYNDLDSLWDIMEATRRETLPHMFFADDRDFIEAHIEKQGFVLLAEYQEELKSGNTAAFMIVRFPELERDNLGYHLGFHKEQLMKTAQLDSVVVLMAHRGHGLLKRLIEEAEKNIRLKGYEHFTAKTHPENRASLKSFFSRGYEPMLSIRERGTERIILYKNIYGDEHKEFFQLFNENGEKTDIIKERKAVHRDGDLHGGAHIWIMEQYKDSENHGIRVLLQKRSEDKDSFPGCYDCSCAGHVDAGEDFISTAIRELHEELSIEADEEDLIFLFKQVVGGEYEFYNSSFKNHEVNFVYLLKKPVDISGLTFQQEEIQGLEWQDADEILNALSDEKTSEKYCMWQEEFQRVISLYKERMNREKKNV